MTIRRLLVCAMLILGAISCSPKATSPTEDAGTAPPSDSAIPGGPDPNYNVGDVETATKITVQVSPASVIGNVEYNELETAKHEIAMADATLHPPYPADFFVFSRVRTPLGYRATDAVLIRQRIYIDTQQDPIAEQSFVWTGREGGINPKDLEVNIIPFVSTLTDSVLVHARAQILWFPNTDPSTIDPASDPQSPERPLEKLSNSLRITFK